MSTIRPIATIILLLLVGVFLFLQMTAKEPPLPEDMADWDAASQLDIGGGQGGVPSLQVGGPVTQGGAPPAFTPGLEELPASFAPAAAQSGSAVSSPAETAPPAFVAEAPPAPGYPTEEPPPFTAEPAAETQPQTPSADNAGGVMAAVVAPPAPYGDQPPAPPVPPAVDRYGAPPAATEASPVASPEEADPTAPLVTGQPVTPTPSMFTSTRTAVQSALDRGELSQALVLLSDWYNDPSLSPGEQAELDTLLSQLAGSVIYSTEHRLEPPYRVQAGQKLQDIAQEHSVPWQLLAKINGIQDPNSLQPGTELKVIRGPFEAVVDLSRRRVTLMLQRRYAGRFPLQYEPGVSVEEGLWTVEQKLLTPGNAGVASGTPTEDRSLVLTNPVAGNGQVAILRGPGSPGAASIDPPGRVLEVNSSDISDLFDILSVGSRVVIRR